MPVLTGQSGHHRDPEAHARGDVGPVVERAAVHDPRRGGIDDRVLGVMTDEDNVECHGTSLCQEAVGDFRPEWRRTTRVCPARTSTAVRAGRKCSTAILFEHAPPVTGHARTATATVRGAVTRGTIWRISVTLIRTISGVKSGLRRLYSTRLARETLAPAKLCDPSDSQGIATLRRFLLRFRQWKPYVGILCGLVVLSASTSVCAAIQLQPVVTGLSNPLYVTHARDGSNRLFIVEQAGRILVLQPGSTTPTIFLDITVNVLSGGERGLLGLTFHPAYATNRRFFVNYTRQPDGATVIAEYQSIGNRPKRG